MDNSNSSESDAAASAAGKTKKTAQSKTFFYLPKWRMNNHFPWPIWAIGWLAIFKGVIWLATDPSIPKPVADIMAIKFIIMLVPYVILGIGVWNLRKWAVWGLICLSAVDLLFFLVLGAYAPLFDLLGYIAGKHFIVLQIVLLTLNGPLGNILILIGIPVMLKHAGQYRQYLTEGAS